MKTVVLYYSRKGNNRFLAHKISDTLNSDIVEIKPRLNLFFFILTGLHFGIKPLEVDLADYDRVILVGPVFMGQFISPLKKLLHNYSSSIKKMSFVTCCGSSDEKKDDKFGYQHVFDKVKKIAGDKLLFSQALSVDLLLDECKKNDPDAQMKTLLSEENFDGAFKVQFDEFVGRVKG